MGYLALYTGLLLPWAAGAVWLVTIERRINPGISPNFFRQAGYGFFLGYAGLALLIKANFWLTESVSWHGLMLVFAFMTIGGALLLRRTAK